MVHKEIIVLLLCVGLCAGFGFPRWGKPIASVQTSQSDLASEYPFSVVANEKCYIFWKHLPNDIIEIALQVQFSGGWISIGFGPYDAGHTRSDMIIAIGGMVKDTYSYKEAFPYIDEVDNVINSTVITQAGSHTLVFWRKLKTSDNFEDREIYTNMPTLVIYAWGLVKDKMAMIHGTDERGTLYINFQTGQAYEYIAYFNWYKATIPILFIGFCFICVYLIFPRRIFYHIRKEYLIFRYFKYSLLDIFMMALWIGANVLMFFAFYDPRKELGVNFGVLMELSLGILFASVVKSSFFSRILRTTYEKQIKYHRFLAWTTVIVVLLHVVVTLVNFAMKGTLAKEMGWISNIYALISTGILIGATFMTLRFIRRERWEMFKYLHFALLGFLALGAVHSTQVAYFCLPGLVLWLLDRAYRMAGKFYRTAKIEFIDTQHPGITIFKIRITRFNYEPGQFLMLTIPSISPTQGHPFTMSSSPMEELVTIHAKSTGSWSRDIRSLKTDSNIWIDGPYGVKPSWRKYEVVVLFSGGIGATPWVSIVRDFIMRKDAEHKPKQMYFHASFKKKDELDHFEDTWELAKQEPSLQISKYVTQMEEEEFDDDKMDSDELSQTVEWEDEEMVDWTKPNLPDPNLTYGRPFFQGIFADLSSKHNSTKDILVMVCGPGAMARAIQDQCFANSEYKNTVYWFHNEVFKL